MQIGYFLSSEDTGPKRLVEQARLVERSGFGEVMISDHYHPWIDVQGHSPFVWGVVGAIATAAPSTTITTGVTCPTLRIHPAVLAQATATASLLCEGRFRFGVGSGENLNEHILGDDWPDTDTRLDMLEEAVEVIRKLWEGSQVSHDGEHYVVRNARIYDPPAEPPPIIVSGFGDEAVALAAEIGEGYWGHSPDRETIEAFDAAGGAGPRYAQLNLCWAEDAADARKTVHHVWPNGGIPGQLSQDLPTWSHFEQAAELVTEEDATASVPCGPDVEPILASVREYQAAGYDHLYFHQIGPDQHAFFDFWTRTLRPALADLETATA